MRDDIYLYMWKWIFLNRISAAKRAVDIKAKHKNRKLKSHQQSRFDGKLKLFTFEKVLH